MLYDDVIGLYDRFRLLHYKDLFSRIKEKEGSLSATEGYSVDAINLLGNPTIKQFSDFLGISQPNATYKINNLEAKGYLVREPSREDKREYRLRLTDKFFSYYGTSHKQVEEAVKQLESTLDEEEIAAFERVIKALNKALTDTEKSE